MSLESRDDVPEIKRGDWVHVGEPGRNAVVCHIFPGCVPAEIEVVYIDDSHRAINENAVWRDGTWEFKISGPSGGYADGSDRLRLYVGILRQGRR